MKGTWVQMGRMGEGIQEDVQREQKLGGWSAGHHKTMGVEC